jgi:hypothetical protein
MGVAAAVVVVGFGALALMSEDKPADDGPGVDLPDYVLAAPSQVQVAYAYAVEHPEVLQYIPCYCSCDQAPFEHQSNWNCFVKSMEGTEVVFDSHGYG